MDLVQLNSDLVRALGVDPKGVAKVTLTIEPNRMPTVLVERHVLNPDGLQTTAEVLHLVARPAEQLVDMTTVADSAQRLEKIVV